MLHQMLHLLLRAPPGRRIDDAAEPVEGAGLKLLDREVDVGAAHVLVEQRGPVGERGRVEVALQGADDGPRRKPSGGSTLVKRCCARSGGNPAPEAAAPATAAVPSRPRASRREYRRCRAVGSIMILSVPSSFDACATVSGA